MWIPRRATATSGFSSTSATSVTAKDGNFPDSVVYDPDGPPTLRLVTCGGQFDANTGHYQSAIVVTAQFVSAS
jgi:hypothetical protein